MRNIQYVSKETTIVRHDECYGRAFSSWLSGQLSGFFSDQTDFVAIDVGAHEGHFFRNFLEENRLKWLILFEPHPLNCERLREKFIDGRVTIEEMAVFSSNKQVNFSFSADSATGSVLKPEGCNAQYSQKLQATTLDAYATKNGLTDKVDIIKIDTQGTDLEVLQGAEEILKRSQPLLVVELIFASLYENQNKAVEIISWLSERGYILGGLFDEHFSRQGWLAWTDACFLPLSRMTDYNAPFRLRESLPEKDRSNSSIVKEKGIRRLISKIKTSIT